MPISSNPPPSPQFRSPNQIPPEPTNPESLRHRPNIIKRIWEHYQSPELLKRRIATLRDQQVLNLASEKARQDSFLTQEALTLQLIQGQKLPQEYLPERALDQARLLFRQKAVAYLLGNRPELEKMYISAFRSTGRKIVASEDIFHLVGKKLSAKIFPDLPEESFQAFERAIGGPEYRFGQNFGTAVFELSRAYPDYPNVSSVEVDLDCLQDLNRIYTDIIAFISGVGYSKWRKIQESNEKTQAKLARYQSRHSALPDPQYLGVLKEPFRIFLEQEKFRQRVEQVLIGVGVIDGINLPAYISKFEKPSPFLAEFQQWIHREYNNLPLVSLYKLIVSIQTISKTNPDFAKVFLVDLEDTLSQYPSPSINTDIPINTNISRLSSEIDSFAAVAEYGINHS
jgi:hypothetical protein